MPVDRPLPRRLDLWKLNALFGLLILAVVALDARLFFLIRDERPRGLAMAERQQRMRVPIPARVGNIYGVAGRRYVPLATSRQVPSCYMDPFLLKDKELGDVAIALADALALDAVQLYQTLHERRDARFVWVKRELTAAEAAAVRAIKCPAIGVTHEWRRSYPNGPLASQVVGFRRVDGVPGAGIELSQSAHLQARDGRSALLVDAHRRAIWPLPEESLLPEDGGHVLLHLDVVVQGYLEEAVASVVGKYGAKWGAGVVVDPQTGEVLAMCSLPSYDPDAYGSADPNDRTNRPVSSPYEPGSIAKPLYAALAVENGVLRWDTRIFCENGVYRALKGGRISDHGHAYGPLTLEDIIVHSSNIGMAKLGEMVGNRGLYEYSKRLGFGDRTGIDVPGEDAGILRPLAKWDGYSLRRIPFGQEVSTTAIQMVMAYAALANGGEMLRPRLVAQVLDGAGRSVWRSERTVVRRLLRPAVARQALEVMHQAVERGTGKTARMRHWTSWGKTGTAQIGDRRGYVSGAYVASYVGGAPLDNPRAVVLVSIYWPDAKVGYYGGTLAAPAVKDVLEKTLTYLDVPPDQGLDTAAR